MHNLGAIIAGIALAASLAGCAATGAVAAPTAPELSKAIAHQVPLIAHEVVSFAAYGDSITAWDPPFAGNPAQSWTLTTATGQVHRLGGWALPGAKLDAMLAHASASSADFTVVMAGTNDMYYGTPIAQRLEEIDSIAKVSHTPRVVLSAVAPYNPNPALGAEWNIALRQHAADRGWFFIDPWHSLRDGDRWVAGDDRGDGVHPSPASAAIVGAAIRSDLIFFKQEGAPEHEKSPAPL